MFVSQNRHIMYTKMQHLHKDERGFSLYIDCVNDEEKRLMYIGEKGWFKDADHIVFFVIRKSYIQEFRFINEEEFNKAYSGEYGLDIKGNYISLK